MISFQRSRIVLDKPPRGMARVFRDAMKAEMRGAATHWHRKMLPDHFEYSAERRYGYRPRTKAHVKRKQRTKGHSLPLVFSGLLKRQVTARGTVPKVTRRRVTLTLTAPKYAYYKPRRPKGAPKLKRTEAGVSPMHAELTTVTDAEADALARLVHERVEMRLNHYRQRKTIR